MKRLTIEVQIEGDKIATLIKDTGFDKYKISDQFEILGIIENIKGIIQNRIKELMNVKR